MRKPVDNMAGGMMPDLPDPIPEDGIWTEARNFRFREGAVEKIKGQRSVFGSASATPIWVEPVSDGLTTFWVYGNEEYLYATDGSLHALVSPISPATLTFSADARLGYTGGAFHGRMVANDAVNPPQVWLPGLGNDFLEISHWPTAHIVDVIRPFGDFLVGLRWNEGGTYNARLVRWSDRAAVGSMPGSWDFADPTNQAGRTELGQTHDKLVDCLPLRDQNIIYKQFHTWIMQYVGGLDVFAFREVFKEAGLLTENCAKAFGARHFAVTDSDIIAHDGNDAQSLVDKKIRRWLFNRLSTTRFKYSFVAADHREREMLFCFPEEGVDFPNLAAVWNWLDNSWSVRDLGEQMAHASSGIVEAAGVTFDEDPGEFDSGPVGIFDEYEYTPWSQRLLLAAATRPQLLQGNVGTTFDGATIGAFALRQNMALSRDVAQIKRVHRIFPKVIGAPGTRIRFRVGASDNQDGTVLMQGPFNFVCGVDRKFDCRVTGRFIHLLIEHNETGPLRFMGFDVEFDHLGPR